MDLCGLFFDFVLRQGGLFVRSGGMKREFESTESCQRLRDHAARGGRFLSLTVGDVRELATAVEVGGGRWTAGGHPRAAEWLEQGLLVRGDHPKVFVSEDFVELMASCPSGPRVCFEGGDVGDAAHVRILVDRILGGGLRTKHLEPLLVMAFVQFAADYGEDHEAVREVARELLRLPRVGEVG